MLFTSDNWAPVHPAVMAALSSANQGSVPAYGNDDATEAATRALSEVFEREVTVAYVTTGSAANGLALACLTPPWGAVLAHEHAHVHIDECGAPEFYTGGAKVLTVPGPTGKMTPDALEAALSVYDPPQYHRVRPAVLNLTQATEWGSVYSPDEVSALSGVARRYGLKVHMDGARFAGAVASGAGSPADLTWRAGVDVLCLGGTKNGCMAAEAVIFFGDEGADQLPWRQKRAGLSWSKHRFLSVQWSAYLKDGLWLDLAGQANRMAKRAAVSLKDHPEVRLIEEPTINEVFVTMPDALADRLRAAGVRFYDWVQPGDRYDRKARRFVTSYVTEDADIDALGSVLDQNR
ncbi:threonine aldolase family protein [Parvularcula dongshanensis]|uniref:L-threonine aldolase n=1 Tax=Parvularcula dongshanensis TaxID=1173995 RepID=A0A840I100_9PROT|nr:low specificity L-threonine aldolase [Parvularcula dongshanensis]MBB4658025.1 threonine aldolase [Parvularcula dongshanensis]